MDQQAEAISLVKSARAGDQNSMDMLRLVGINARKGNPTAIQTQKYMSDYITDNPMSVPQTQMGEEAIVTCGILMTCDNLEIPNWLCDLSKLAGRDGLLAATTILAQNAELTNPRITEMANGLEESKRKLFLWGITACIDEGPSNQLLAKQPDDVKGVALAGKVVGKAQRLQLVLQGAPISILDLQAGLEHGE